MTDIVNVSVILKGNGHQIVGKSVPDYEVPVLRQLHGHDNVLQTDRRAAEFGEIPETPQDAYGSLVGRYNTKDGEAALKYVYRDVELFTEQVKLKTKPASKPKEPAQPAAAAG